MHPISPFIPPVLLYLPPRARRSTRSARSPLLRGCKRWAHAWCTLGCGATPSMSCISSWPTRATVRLLRLLYPPLLPQHPSAAAHVLLCAPVCDSTRRTTATNSSPTAARCCQSLLSGPHHALICFWALMHTGFGGLLGLDLGTAAKAEMVSFHLHLSTHDQMPAPAPSSIGCISSSGALCMPSSTYQPHLHGGGARH